MSYWRPQRELATDTWLGPFSRREHDTIAEVFTFCGLSSRDRIAAWKDITKQWYDTSGRFYAYTWAHNIAATYMNKGPSGHFET